MRNKRRHKRYSLDIMEISGQMIFANTVEIIDISAGGIALRADKRLNMGTTYQVKLQDRERALNVQGTVVRSALSGTVVRSDGERVPVYTAGMMFKEDSARKVAAFLEDVAHERKDAGRVQVEHRRTVRFHIKTPTQAILDFPAQYIVKVISLSGMLIEAGQGIGAGVSVPMELAIDETPIHFQGRVVSCDETKQRGRVRYEIAVEFSDLTDYDRSVLSEFIDYLATVDAVADKAAGGDGS